MKITHTVSLVALIMAGAALGYKWMDVTLERPAPQINVDTLRIITTVYDTVTVISRAADTVRVRIKEIGPLTERDLVQTICGQEYLYGDKRDSFKFNVYGMVFCPKERNE